MFFLVYLVMEVKIWMGMGCLEIFKFIEIFLRRVYYGMKYGEWWEINILGFLIFN